MQRVGFVVFLGSVFAFILALTHPTGGVQIGGANGYRYPSWAVLVLAPVVAVVGLQVAAWARQRELRRKAKRRERRAMR